MDANSFGDHVRRLREARGLTQEVMALRCGLAADTIRRLECGQFSPSLRTLRKLVRAFDMSVSTLFVSYELGDDDDALRDIVALLATRSRADLEWLGRFLRAVLKGIDELKR